MEKRKVADLWLRKTLQLLYQRRTVTRPEIIESTGLNLASVSQAMRLLLEHGTVLKMGDLHSDGGGRRREVFSLNPEAAYFIVSDIEGDCIRFALQSLNSDVRYRWEEHLGWTESMDVGKLIGGMLHTLRALNEDQRKRVVAAGISFPGLLDERGRLTAVNLGWTEYPLIAELNEKVRASELQGMPVYLEPHKHASVLAERWLGCASGCDHGLLLFAERGIGMGLVTGGRRVRGWRDMAGEIGHITIDPESREVCRCGKRGCLETVASTPSMVRDYMARTGSGRELRITEIYQRARERDEAALATVERAARALGLALSHAVSLLNPSAIVLSGDLTAGEDLLIPLIREEIARHTLPALTWNLQISTSSLGLDLRLKGAGAHAFRRAIADPLLLKKICSPVLPAPNDRCKPASV